MGKPRLTVEQVLDARLRYAAGADQREWKKLAKEYGTYPDVLRKAAMGETYKHLPMPRGKH